MPRKAAQTAKSAGISGERGVAVVEGMASARAGAFDDTLGDLIPGVSLLVNRARRIVLVTDQNVYLFHGPRYDRPGARLGSYPLKHEVMSFDGKKLSFPDDQVVHMTRFQAEILANAAGIDQYAGTPGEFSDTPGSQASAPSPWQAALIR
jgi:hypothetical protein